MQDFYESVKKFNNIAGSTNTDIKAFKNQIRLIYEEGIQEGEEALKDKSVVKMLDSTIDTLYVVMGNLQRLELMGCDIEGAMKQVCEDNSKKFPNDVSTAQASVLHYNNQNINVNYTYNDKYKRYVLKDSNGKIRKPVNFVSTDLSKYVPKELQEKGIV